MNPICIRCDTHTKHSIYLLSKLWNQILSSPFYIPSRAHYLVFCDYDHFLQSHPLHVSKYAIRYVILQMMVNVCQFCDILSTLNLFNFNLFFQPQMLNFRCLFLSFASFWSFAEFIKTIRLIFITQIVHLCYINTINIPCYWLPH